MEARSEERPSMGWRRDQATEASHVIWCANAKRPERSKRTCASAVSMWHSAQRYAMAHALSPGPVERWNVHDTSAPLAGSRIPSAATAMPGAQAPDSPGGACGRTHCSAV